MTDETQSQADMQDEMQDGNGAEELKDQEIEAIPNLVGKVVFLEKAPDASEASHYYDGEYIILRQSAFSLHGVKSMAIDYGVQEIRHFALAGKNRYLIVDFRDDFETVKTTYRSAVEFAAERHSDNKHWIDSVYTGAAQVARMMEQIFPDKLCSESSDSEEPYFPAVPSIEVGGVRFTAAEVDSVVLKRKGRLIQINSRRSE